MKTSFCHLLQSEGGGQTPGQGPPLGLLEVTTSLLSASSSHMEPPLRRKHESLVLESQIFTPIT